MVATSNYGSHKHVQHYCINVMLSHYSHIGSYITSFIFIHIIIQMINVRSSTRNQPSPAAAYYPHHPAYPTTITPLLLLLHAQSLQRHAYAYSPSSSLTSQKGATMYHVQLLTAAAAGTGVAHCVSLVSCKQRLLLSFWQLVCQKHSDDEIVPYIHHVSLVSNGWC